MVLTMMVIRLKAGGHGRVMRWTVSKRREKNWRVEEVMVKIVIKRGESSRQ